MFHVHLFNNVFYNYQLGQVGWSNWVKFVVFHIFAVDFLSYSSTDYWERYVDVTSYKCGFMYPFSWFFASRIIWLFCLVHTHLGLLCLLGVTLFSLYNVILFVGDFQCSEVYLIWYLYSHSCFFFYIKFLKINVGLIYIFLFCYFHPTYRIVFELNFF